MYTIYLRKHKHTHTHVSQSSRNSCCLLSFCICLCLGFSVHSINSRWPRRTKRHARQRRFNIAFTLYSTAWSVTGDATGNSDPRCTVVGRNTGTEAVDKWFGTSFAKVDINGIDIYEAALIMGPLMNCIPPSIPLHQSTPQSLIIITRRVRTPNGGRLHEPPSPVSTGRPMWLTSGRISHEVVYAGRGGGGPQAGAGLRAGAGPAGRPAPAPARWDIPTS